MTIITHGLTINMDQLLEVSKATCDWPANSGWHTDIFYDQNTGDVWSADIMDGNWKEYSDPAVIKACSVTKKHTPQWITDKIAESVAMERDNADWR